MNETCRDCYYYGEATNKIARPHICYAHTQAEDICYRVDRICCDFSSKDQLGLHDSIPHFVEYLEKIRNDSVAGKVEKQHE